MRRGRVKSARNLGPGPAAGHTVEEEIAVVVTAGVVTVTVKAVAMLTDRAGRLGAWSPVGLLGTGHVAVTVMMTGQAKVVDLGHHMIGLNGKGIIVYFY